MRLYRLGVSEVSSCVRSVLGAELYACAHAYDIGVASKHSIDLMLGRSVDIILFTDSHTLFDCLVTWCATAERRLQIDIAVLRQALASEDLTNAAWIRTAFNPSDGLTRPRVFVNFCKSCCSLIIFLIRSERRCQ
jgi:hypothetical protein